MQKKDKYTIALVCVALGALLAIQFRIVQGNQFNLLPSQKSVELANELKKAQTEKESLMRELARSEEKLANVQTSASKDNAFLKSLNDELDRYRVIAGFKDVKGPGVTVTVDNPPQGSQIGNEANIVNDFSLILELINELKAAGAEAVSINDQRLISTSEIRTAGYAININTIPQKPPFIIKAIGEKETLEGALIQNNGIVSIMRESGYLVSVRKEAEVLVPRYKDVYKIKYAHPVDSK